MLIEEIKENAGGCHPSAGNQQITKEKCGLGCNSLIEERPAWLNLEGS
jgi:hypothetical protein